MIDFISTWIGHLAKNYPRIQLDFDGGIMWPSIKRFCSQLFDDFSNDDCTSMAAALTYYTIFALPSLLLILIFVAGLVFGADAASGQIQAKLGAQMGPQVAAEIQTMVSSAARNQSGGIIATLFGIAGLLFSATGVLLQLQMCLNRAWKVSRGGSGVKSFVMKRVRSGFLLLILAVLTIVSLVAGSILSAVSAKLPFGDTAYIAEIVISIIIFSTLFAAVLKMLPDVRIRWADVWVGGFVIALLFELGKFLIGLYLGHTGTSSTYGAAGSLALLLLWIYYSALVFLLGVEFTQVWVRYHGRSVEPKEGAEVIPGHASAAT
ncbi:MAG: YihY/virulence factor BrkB family protein [Candidatus Binataceae bacterium]